MVAASSSDTSVEENSEDDWFGTTSSQGKDIKLADETFEMLMFMRGCCEFF